LNEARVRSRFHNANRSSETAHGATLPIFIEKTTMPLDFFVVLATCQLLRVIPGEPLSEFRELVMATHKCEVWSLGNPAAAAELAETLGMKHAAQGSVAAGCPPGAPEFVKGHADTAAGKVVQLIERVRPLSAQHKQLLLRRSLQLKILHISRVAHKSDVLDAMCKVEGAIDGMLQIMKC
jgi:hypothetical protein